MAQLKDLLVTGASRLIGDAYTNTIQITSLKAPTSAGGSTYGTGTNGQVLLSNGSSIYWGSAAPTVTESTVSGWGFTKNTGTITGATTNGGLKVTGTTLGHSNTAITAKTTAGVYPVKIDALGHITEAGTAIVSSAAASGGTTLSLVTTGEKYTWNNKSNLAIGTSATTAAAGNHTHTTSLATDSGTATVTLAHNTTYKLTAGGTNVIFKTPTDSNTDTKVNVVARGTTKSYLLATTTSPTSTATGVTAVAETGVYLDTTAAKLVATTFKGALEGNATTFGKGSHTAAVTANEFALTTGTATVVGNVSSTTMPRVSNANAEMIIKAHPTSGENYHEARLGFSSDTNLYYMPVNGTSWKKLVYEDKMYEANLQWGGKNFSASYGCIDAAMIGELGANRFAFLNPNGITSEYSTNGGSTWTDYGQTGTGKTAIFSVGNGMYLGKHTTAGSSTVNDQLRITIDTSLAGIYTALNKIALYISTNGANNVKVKIEKATHAAQTTFQTHLDWTQISGYSGWNILNINEFTTYGNTDSQYQKIRFTFKQETAGTNRAASISKIYAFGGMGWTTPSNMATNGHLYNYDKDQTAFFPNTVWANQSLAVRAKTKDDTALAQGSFESYNKTGRVVGQMVYQHSSNSSNYDIVNTGQWMFRQYSPKSTPENATTGYAEVYKLPVVDSNITGSSKSYDILTTKLHFTNKTVATSAWAASTTYSGFSWKADITCNGVSANHVPNVIFDYNELISGNFCPFADSSSNKVTIYCKTKPTATITIPTIYCT